KPVENLVGLRIRKNDGVEMISKMASLNSAIVNGDGRESVLLENPARPAFVDIGRPGAVKPDARLLGGNRVWRNPVNRSGDDRILPCDCREAVARDSGDDRGAISGCEADMAARRE